MKTRNIHIENPREWMQIIRDVSTLLDEQPVSKFVEMIKSLIFGNLWEKIRDWSIVPSHEDWFLLEEDKVGFLEKTIKKIRNIAISQKGVSFSQDIISIIDWTRK